MNQATHIPLFGITTIAPVFAASSSLAADAREEVRFEIRDGQRQWFLDGHGIAELTKLTRTMHSPVKKGAAIVIDEDCDGWFQPKLVGATHESHLIDLLTGALFHPSGDRRQLAGLARSSREGYCQ